MTPAELILATYEDVTYFKVPCLSGQSLGLDVMADIENDAELEEFSSTLKNFLELTTHDIKKLAPYVFSEFKACEEDLIWNGIEITISNEDAVWNELEFKDVFLVRQGDEEQIVYVVMSAECSWDEEHGVQFVFRRGNELTRISEQDGNYTSCDLPDLPNNQDSN